ncbi:hypothetical protein AB0H71_33820 [Nocardia sp. NPDC050697]|uniref:acyl carrier protein n=1 Tax=Nocardia sp. NPDC050697 TaxID=3155158 RepID=UPI0033FFE807
MSIESNSTAGVADDAGLVEQKILDYLTTRLKAEIEPSQDIFAKGLVTSIFAMELVVYLEGSFNIEIIGSNLRLENFVSVDAMVDLVTRLQGDN